MAAASPKAKGDLFEERIFLLVRQLLVEEAFPSPQPYCRLFKQKAYYSRDRGREIKFDVSVEVWLPDAPTYSLLYLFECKDFKRPVSVGRVEEFFAKVQQVASANGKAIFASTSEYETGAFAYAEAKGIGLIRCFGTGEHKWILRRSPSLGLSIQDGILSSREIHRGLTDPLYKSRYFDLFGSIGRLLTNSLQAIFTEFLNQQIPIEPALAQLQLNVPSLGSQVPFLPSARIDELATNILREVGYRGGWVDLERVCEWLAHSVGLKTTLGATPNHDESELGTLGTVSFAPPEITIFGDTANPRQRFTLAHELGHLLLGHERYLEGEVFETTDLELPHALVSTLSFKDIKAIEWQANHFASCLLLPRASIRAAFFAKLQVLDLRDRGVGHLYVDDQTCNQRNLSSMLLSLTTQFGASRRAVELKLRELGLVNAVPDLSRIGLSFSGLLRELLESSERV